MRPRNPEYDKPDAHEMAITAALAGAGQHFHLVESTRDQRRIRAAYYRRKALRSSAPDSKPS